MLVSIQSLVLVPEPYFNEPAYQCQYKTDSGILSSQKYNATIIEATLKYAIIEMIKHPSECFKNAILDHFYLKAEELIKQCHQWHKELLIYYKRINNEGEIGKFEVHFDNIFLIL